METIQIKAKCLRETEKAILVFVEAMAEEVWVPKSQVSEESEVQGEDDDGVLEISEWFARKEGLDGAEDEDRFSAKYC